MERDDGGVGSLVGELEDRLPRLAASHRDPDEHRHDLVVERRWIGDRARELAEVLELPGRTGRERLLVLEQDLLTIAAPIAH